MSPCSADNSKLGHAGRKSNEDLKDFSNVAGTLRVPSPQKGLQTLARLNAPKKLAPYSLLDFLSFTADHSQRG